MKALMEIIEQLSQYYEHDEDRVLAVCKWKLEHNDVPKEFLYFIYLYHRMLKERFQDKLADKPQQYANAVINIELAAA